MRSRLPQMLWGLCLLIAVTGSGQAAVFQTTLDNGLTVLIEENHANGCGCGGVCPYRQYLRARIPGQRHIAFLRAHYSRGYHKHTQ